MPSPSGPGRALPVENFLKRRLLTIFELMMPSADSSVGSSDSKMEEQFSHHHGARRRHFEVGDAIYAKDYRGPKSTWMFSITVRKMAARLTPCVAENSFGRGK
ncbi:hypothetical protein Tcan_00480, partial [Toxocara canis]